MFSDKYCQINKDTQRKNQKFDSYFLKQIYDEERRVNDLKDQELLATAENPRVMTEKVTTDICKELRNCKIQDILEEKRRQQLRTNCHELRQLQTQLQSAFVSKQLKEQTTYMARQKEEERRKKREEDKKWSEECEQLKKSVLQQEEEERQKKSALRDILQVQMDELHQRRRLEFEDVIKDREEMQKRIKRIQAEEKAELTEAERFKERCKTEMEETYRNREMQKQLEIEKNIDDSERYLAYQQECDELKARMGAERKRLQLEKEAISEKIGLQLANVNNEKKKRENLLLSLLVEERKAKEDERYRQILNKRSKERQQLRTELEDYRKELKLEKERKLSEEERRVHAEQMHYLAERDKLDQLSNEKRRRKIIEHNKALREMIEIRRNQRVAEISERIRDFERILNEEKEKDHLVEEERIRMLRAVPSELLSYLPPGVLKPSDREFLPLQKP